MDTLLKQQLNESGYIGDFNLSSLIEACGNDFSGTYFRWLKNEKSKWHAQARRHPVSLGDVRAKGSTPEEAVATLWLELNKK